MNSTKKTLTTLTAAAALAIGGIAIAQTSADNSGAGASLGSSSTMQNSGDQSLNSSTAPADSSTMSSNSAASDTSTLGAAPAQSDMSAPQMDRN